MKKCCAENELIKKISEIGEDLAKELYSNEKTSKVYKEGIKDIIKKNGWQFLNCIYTNNSNKFLGYILRLYSIVNTSPDSELLEFLNTKNSEEFKKYAMAFMIGFLSNKKEN